MPESCASANQSTAPGTSSRSERRWPAIIAGCVIALGALAAYDNCFSIPFTFDDTGVIVDNASIRHLWPIWDALSPPRASGMTATGRPLFNLSLAVNYALDGTAVWGYHVLNVAIHILAGWVLFGIVRRTLLRPGLRERFGAAAFPLATAVAVLWTVHPLQTESVTYVVQRAESLMGLFYFLTLYCFIRGSESAKSGWWYSLCMVACVLGMMTKEVMISAPLIVLLYDRTFVEGSFGNAWRRHRRLYLSLASTWLVLGYLLIGSGNRGGTAGLGTHVSSWEYALTQCWAVTRYLRLSVWPHPLIFDYGMWLAKNLAEVAPSALILVVVLAAVAMGLRYRPALGFLGAWFLLILAPTSSIVPVMSQTAAEHRMYLPLAAVVTLVVTGLYAWMGRRSLALFPVLAVGLGFLTFQRNTDYRDELTLWSDTVNKRPGSLRARDNLGLSLMDAGRLPDAMAQFEQALRLNPDFLEAHFDLGVALGKVGDLPEAIRQYEEALRIRPDLADAHNNLGALLTRVGRFEEAVGHCQRAVQLKPDLADAHYNLGAALERVGKVDEALGQYKEVARIAPRSARAHNDLADALVRRGRVAEAIEHYQQALRIRPDYAEAYCNLGVVLAGLGRVTEAIVQFEEAVRYKPDYAEALNNLGVALWRVGRIPEAIKCYEQALRSKPDYAEAHYNLGGALEQAGRIPEAIAHYQEALRVNPDLPQVQDRLARLPAVSPKGQ